MTATSELIIRQIIKTASRHIIMLILLVFYYYLKKHHPHPALKITKILNAKYIIYIN